MEYWSNGVSIRTSFGRWSNGVMRTWYKSSDGYSILPQFPLFPYSSLIPLFPIFLLFPLFPLRPKGVRMDIPCFPNIIIQKH